MRDADAAPSLAGEDDERWMRRALELGTRAQAAGDVPVGAVLLHAGRIFETCNARESCGDPTAHAEMLALRAAAAAAGGWRLVGAQLYVTKEPCVMCAGAIAAARVARVVYGAGDPKGGAAGGAIDVFGSRAVNHRVTVVAGVLAEETAEQLRAFFAAKRDARTT